MIEEGAGAEPRTPSDFIQQVLMTLRVPGQFAAIMYARDSGYGAGNPKKIWPEMECEDFRYNVMNQLHAHKEKVSSAAFSEPDALDGWTFAAFAK